MAERFKQTIKSVVKDGVLYEVRELLAPEEIFSHFNYETQQDEIDWVNIEFMSQYGYRHFKFQPYGHACDRGSVNFKDGSSVEFKSEKSLESGLFADCVDEFDPTEIEPDDDLEL